MNSGRICVLNFDGYMDSASSLLTAKFNDSTDDIGYSAWEVRTETGVA